LRFMPYVLLAAFGLLTAGLSFGTPLTLLGLSLLPAAVVLEARRDLESVAADLSREGIKSQAPAMITGKSGIKHEFALAVVGGDGKPKVVVDTELSIKDVDEMKVLKFYVKVFDVSPDKAVLCVSPRLNERAKSLAKEYQIIIAEDEVPKNLISATEKLVKQIAGGAAN
jgi:hypothetical protein